MRIVEPRPALVPLVFEAALWQPFAVLAGVSIPARVEAGAGSFDEDLLFTHRGLSGPAILQISTYWSAREPIRIDLLPDIPASALLERLIELKRVSRQTVGNALAGLLPQRLADQWLGLMEIDNAERVASIPGPTLRAVASSLKTWQLTPAGTEGYRKAEVTRGGVATDQLSQTTFEAHKIPGLHFIGEVVDVTGWLGGYNFQWAWASGYAAGNAL
jgi:predicted Rossmann fold flavoprotein